ncbi:MAG: SDR family oxidoreductase [Syntrophaceae bacterium]
MQILITGATGFTGKALMPMLEEAGYGIVNIVRQDRGYTNQILWNFTDDLPESIPECQVIIHLAANVDFQNSLNILQYNVNTVSTAKLAAYASKTGAYFIFASTVGVHGTKPTVFDGTTPINPDSNYAMSKYLAEVVTKTFTTQYTILRIGGIYGLGGPVHLGLNSSITNAYYNNEKPTIKGNGKARRNYICVCDVVQWILYLLKRYEENKASVPLKEILYLAGPEVMTIEEYLKEVDNVLLDGSDIHRMDGPEGKDMVIKYNSYPFRPTTFRQYLKSIKQFRSANTGNA